MPTTKTGHTLSDEEYEASKQDLCETTLDCLERYVPDIRAKLDHVEASTPRTFQHYTQHDMGASFGTKFEGLKVSRDSARANQRACTTRAALASSCPAGSVP